MQISLNSDHEVMKDQQGEMFPLFETIEATKYLTVRICMLVL